WIAQRRARRNRESLCSPQSGVCRQRTAAARTSGLRQIANRALQVSTCDRVCERAAAVGDRQAAEGAFAGNGTEGKRIGVPVHRLMLIGKQHIVTVVLSGVRATKERERSRRTPRILALTIAASRRPDETR